MRRFSLSRSGRVIRNLLVCLLLWGIVYTMLGFPAYTVEGMCRRFQKEYFLGELEPLYVLKTGRDTDSDYTFIIARSGDVYAAFQYERHLLQNWRRYTRQPQVTRDALCMARDGVLYVAAEGLADAESVTAEVETLHRSFTLEGERLGEGVYGFSYVSPDHDIFRFQHGDLVYGEPVSGDPVGPDEEIDLLDAVNLWYWEPTGGGSYTLIHEDLPVTVTTRGSGGELTTLSLTVETYDLNSRY